MKNSWLVQRLTTPRGYDNPFAFGGGLRNGGLSDGAMDLLRDIFSFDYMGSAEFELGALPNTLQSLAADADKLVSYSFSVPLADVPAHVPETQQDFDITASAPTGYTEIFVICRQAHAQEVSRRIVSWTKEMYPPLKEALRLTPALRPYSEWDTDVRGWLELDNGFFFFLDRDMWKKTCALFGVEL